MTKFKKKLTVIVSVFLIIGVLGSVAAIFAIQKYEPIVPEVKSSDVGYIIGAKSKGTGINASSSKIFTFAPSAYNETTWKAEANIWENPVLLGYSYNADSSTKNAFSFEADEDGDTHLKFASNESATTSGTNCSLSLPLNFGAKSKKNYPERAGKYIVEFDIKIDEDYVFTHKYPDSDANIVEFAFGNGSRGNIYNYTSTYFYQSEEDGYYTYSGYGSRYNALKNDHYLLKYGEWYNIRFELTLDNTSTKFSDSVYINGVLVEQNSNKAYSSKSLSSYGYAPNAFSVIPRTMYAMGLDIYIDNYYTGFEK